MTLVRDQPYLPLSLAPPIHAYSQAVSQPYRHDVLLLTYLPSDDQSKIQDSTISPLREVPVNLLLLIVREQMVFVRQTVSPWAGFLPSRDLTIYIYIGMLALEYETFTCRATDRTENRNVNSLWNKHLTRGRGKGN